MKKLELLRNILINAVYMNAPKELILKLSQKLDRYVVEYYRKRY